MTIKYGVQLPSMPSIKFIFLNINHPNKIFTFSEHAVPPAAGLLLWRFFLAMEQCANGDRIVLPKEAGVRVRKKYARQRERLRNRRDIGAADKTEAAADGGEVATTILCGRM
jgi:hypothetical protein